ncbi:cytochrome c oxidase assembly protein [Paenibacillus sp. TAB 01]|uniref:cytochrome c oxidase assembly protein n=1 Tax=Paenibacillus sp. TAB 01 TaxID=3368988 RepID=UPI0037507141
MDIWTMIQVYGFRSVFSPELFICMVFVAVFYLNYRTNSITRWEKRYFLLGLFLFYLVLGGPINLMGHFWFSLHMFQQSVLYLVIPPLIYRGIPVEWFKFVRNNTILNGIFSVIGHPLIAIFLFNGAFSFYHIPFIFDAAMSNYALHNALHLLLLISAFGLWWPVFSPYCRYALTPLRKMGYIFLNGFLLTPACALIIFANELLYTTYSNSTHLLCLPFYYERVEVLPFTVDWLTPLNDQQLGGVVMKIIQELSYGSMLGYIFFQWYRSEKEAEEVKLPLLRNET